MKKITSRNYWPLSIRLYSLSLNDIPSTSLQNIPIYWLGNRWQVQTTAGKSRWKHKPNSVMSNKSVFVLWNIPVQTDRTIKNSQPDIIVKDLLEKLLFHWGHNPCKCKYFSKLFNKLSKYKDLETKIQKTWHLKT